MMSLSCRGGWLLPVFCLMILTGCASHINQKPVTNSLYATSLTRCQNEASALQYYNAQLYKKHQNSLTALLDRSAQYLLMREQLSTDATVLIDSVYQAKIARHCHQIHTDLFNAMLAKADEE